MKAEQQYTLHHNFLQAKIQTFLKERNYELRISPGSHIVQLLKQSSDKEYFMTINIFPRSRSEVPNEKKESLALHEMDDFGKYFEYVPIHQPQFKEDEASRVQIMKDDRLDDLNPLGLDLNEIENLDLVITIEKKYEESIFFIKSETTQGKIQFSGMCIIDKQEKSENWKENLLNQIEYFKNDYSVDFFEFSDSLQKKMVDFLQEIGLKPSDSYYIEMINLYHQQHLYLEWLTVLQTKIKNNKLHS